jgi:hypothetical protein
MRAVLALAFALACGCAADHTRSGDGGVLDLEIDGIAFRLSSGGAVTARGALVLYLTDQPDACAAITHIPAGRATVFRLEVGAAAGSSSIAPGAGDLRVSAAGVDEQKLEVSDGTVAWSTNADGTVSVAQLDVGFVGTTDRLRATGLQLEACQ